MTTADGDIIRLHFKLLDDNTWSVTAYRGEIILNTVIFDSVPTVNELINSFKRPTVLELATELYMSTLHAMWFPHLRK